jgi:hypothetical protein
MSIGEADALERPAAYFRSHTGEFSHLFVTLSPVLALGM